MNEGIALWCSTSGMIENIVYNTLEIPGQDFERRSFSDVLDAASSTKASAFLEAILNNKAAFDWEMNVPQRNVVTTLHFAGSLIDGRILILGAASRGEMGRLTEELSLMNSDQMNRLRVAMKDLAVQSAISQSREDAHYDELSRLNNELTNLQRELAKKNGQLESLHEQKNRFIGMAAHDLRNPLGAIKSYSEFLADELGPGISEEHREFLAIIHSSSEFMLRLVEDLLDVAKIEAGKLQLELTPVDLPALVARNLAINRLLADKKHITIHYILCDEIPPMLLDEAKVTQVLNNLVSNAVKFSNSGTTVTVHVSRKESCVAIRVSDQGQGIPEHELQNLFKPFQRTSVRATGGEASTGLGLSIARSIVLGHGGTIEVESAVGIGTSFTVTLPLITE